MKLQSQYRYNSTLMGLNDQYIPMGIDSFYINAPCIIAKDSTISTGKTYLLLTRFNEVIQAYYYELVDVYYDNILLHLILRDKANHRSTTIVHDFNSTNVHKWWLIDFEYLQSLQDEVEVKQYCGC